MKKVILNDATTISLHDISEYTPIFAKRGGVMAGMIVHETACGNEDVDYEDHHGWILRTGGSVGSTGFHKTREECIENCVVHNYEFYVN